MNIINKHGKNILIVLGIFFLLLYIFNPQVVEKEVPVKVEVPIPVVKKEFDTVYYPKPVYVETKQKIDSSLYQKYKELQDSIKKDSLFKETIKIKTYKEKIEDDTLTINLNMEVRGELLNYQVGYKTKPRNILLDTTVKVPIHLQDKLFGGFSVGVPVLDKPSLNVEPVIKGSLYWKTKKDNLISVEFDSQGRGWIGYAWKF